VPSCVPADGHL
jgi:hypothetical protein